jgi:hypothetical protein
MAKKAAETVQVKVRMRRDQQQRLERDATKGGLTVNAEILRRLRVSYEVEKLGGSEYVRALVESDRDMQKNFDEMAEEQRRANEYDDLKQRLEELEKKLK